MTAFNAKAFDAIIKKAAARLPEVEPPALAPLEQFVWSFLLWEASGADAERALKRVTAAVVDFNELRVCLPDEIVSIVGPRYPRSAERAARLKSGLHDVFLREHAVSFERLKDMNKRTARQWLETLSGVPPFVSGRMALTVVGGHAAPLDERLLVRLTAADVFETETPLDKAASALERHVKAEDGLMAHRALLLWAEEAPAPAAGRSRSVAKATTRPASPAGVVARPARQRARKD